MVLGPVALNEWSQALSQNSWEKIWIFNKFPVGVVFTLSFKKSLNADIGLYSTYILEDRNSEIIVLLILRRKRSHCCRLTEAMRAHEEMIIETTSLIHFAFLCTLATLAWTGFTVFTHLLKKIDTLICSSLRKHQPSQLCLCRHYKLCAISKRYLNTLNMGCIIWLVIAAKSATAKGNKFVLELCYQGNGNCSSESSLLLSKVFCQQGSDSAEIRSLWALWDSVLVTFHVAVSKEVTGWNSRKGLFWFSVWIDTVHHGR